MRHRYACQSEGPGSDQREGRVLAEARKPCGGVEKDHRSLNRIKSRLTGNLPRQTDDAEDIYDAEDFPLGETCQYTGRRLACQDYPFILLSLFSESISLS